jgi:26S proteasome regulatory subunit N2
VISFIFEKTRDASLLAYAMEVVLDNNFSLSYRDQVLNFLYPLFPPIAGESSSPHVLTLMRIMVTLSTPSLVIPLLSSLASGQELLAYQLAFDLAEGGAQDFLENVRKDLPEGDEASIHFHIDVLFTNRDSAEVEAGLGYCSQDSSRSRTRQALP